MIYNWNENMERRYKIKKIYLLFSLVMQILAESSMLVVSHQRQTIVTLSAGSWSQPNPLASMKLVTRNQLSTMLLEPARLIGDSVSIFLATQFLVAILEKVYLVVFYSI
jgi:hypothetical protein